MFLEQMKRFLTDEYQEDSLIQIKLENVYLIVYDCETIKVSYNIEEY